jgi:hypothetical protein
VYRHCKKYGAEAKVFMVDQLWLWVIGKGTTELAFDNYGIRCGCCHNAEFTMGMQISLLRVSPSVGTSQRMTRSMFSTA